MSTATLPKSYARPDFLPPDATLEDIKRAQACAHDGHGHALLVRLYGGRVKNLETNPPDDHSAAAVTEYRLNGTKEERDFRNGVICWGGLQASRQWAKKYPILDLGDDFFVRGARCDMQDFETLVSKQDPGNQKFLREHCPATADELVRKYWALGEAITNSLYCYRKVDERAIAEYLEMRRPRVDPDDIERRFFYGDLVSFDAIGTDRPPAVSGYAAVYNSVSRDLGGFVEVLRPGCFDRALAEMQPVVLNVQHQGGLTTLASTRSDTLALKADRKGLKFWADLPNTSAGRDVAELVRKNILSKCSFAFSLPSADCERWDHMRNPSLREVLDCDLYDVSIVDSPAYESTSVEIEEKARLNFDRVEMEYFEKRYDQQKLLERVERECREALESVHKSHAEMDARKK